MISEVPVRRLEDMESPSGRHRSTIEHGDVRFFGDIAISDVLKDGESLLADKMREGDVVILVTNYRKYPPGLVNRPYWVGPPTCFSVSIMMVAGETF